VAGQRPRSEEVLALDRRLNGSRKATGVWGKGFVVLLEDAWEAGRYAFEKPGAEKMRDMCCITARLSSPRSWLSSTSRRDDGHSDQVGRAYGEVHSVPGRFRRGRMAIRTAGPARPNSDVQIEWRFECGGAAE